MKIGGLQKVSLVDFPAHIAAVVFTKGCNFRCPFCFNRSLVLQTKPTISQRQVLTFLEKRKKILDGVVITGGEPLLQSDLKDFIKEIKKLNYPLKLDTNGSLPNKLKEILKKSLINYVALDFKAPLDGRLNNAIAKQDFNPELWQETLNLLLNSKIPFELRTTVVPGIHNQEILTEMAKQLKLIFENCKLKIENFLWFWQGFRPGHCLDPQFDEKKPFPNEQLEDFLKAAKRHFSNIKIRHY